MADSPDPEDAGSHQAHTPQQTPAQEPAQAPALEPLHPPAAQPLDWPLPDEEATAALARQLAELACGRVPGGPSAGGRIHLRGDLGAGKTTLARALLRAGGVTGRIKSPSYALLESYNVSNLYFYHLDFYRFRNAHEWRDAGFDELLDEQAVVLIEWPEQAGTRLPPPDLDIRLEYAGTGRRAFLSACSKKGQLWLTHLGASRR